MGQYSYLYKLAAWKSLRRWRLSTEPLCRFCLIAGQTTEATVADHVKPHRGDMVRFLDPYNLQSLCKPCHDRHKQRAEIAGYDLRVDAEGFPIDPEHPFNAKGSSEPVGERFFLGHLTTGEADEARHAPRQRDYGAGGVGSVSGTDRPGTGGGHSHALTRNCNQKGK